MDTTHLITIAISTVTALITSGVASTLINHRLLRIRYTRDTLVLINRVLDLQDYNRPLLKVEANAGLFDNIKDNLTRLGREDLRAMLVPGANVQEVFTKIKNELV